MCYSYSFLLVFSTAVLIGMEKVTPEAVALKQSFYGTAQEIPQVQTVAEIRPFIQEEREVASSWYRLLPRKSNLRNYAKKGMIGIGLGTVMLSSTGILYAYDQLSSNDTIVLFSVGLLSIGGSLALETYKACLWYKIKKAAHDSENHHELKNLDV